MWETGLMKPLPDSIITHSKALKNSLHDCITVQMCGCFLQSRLPIAIWLVTTSVGVFLSHPDQVRQTFVSASTVSFLFPFSFPVLVLPDTAEQTDYAAGKQAAIWNREESGDDIVARPRWANINFIRVKLMARTDVLYGCLDGWERAWRGGGMLHCVAHCSLSSLHLILINFQLLSNHILHSLCATKAGANSKVK